MRRRSMDRRADRLPCGPATLPPHIDSCKLRTAMQRLSHHHSGLQPIVEMPEEREFEKEDSFYFLKKGDLGGDSMLTEFIDNNWSSDDESEVGESSGSDLGDNKSDSELTEGRDDESLDLREPVDEDARVSILRLRAAFRKAWIDMDSGSETEGRDCDSTSSSRASTPPLPGSDNASPIPTVCFPRAIKCSGTIDSDTEVDLQKYWAGRLDESKAKADAWMPSNARGSFGSFRPLPPTNSMESFDFGDRPNSLWKRR